MISVNPRDRSLLGKPGTNLGSSTYFPVRRRRNGEIDRAHDIRLSTGCGSSSSARIAVRRCGRRGQAAIRGRVLPFIADSRPETMLATPALLRQTSQRGAIFTPHILPFAEFVRAGGEAAKIAKLRIASGCAIKDSSGPLGISISPNFGCLGQACNSLKAMTFPIPRQRDPLSEFDPGRTHLEKIGSLASHVN